MVNLLNATRAAILFTKAGTALEREDLAGAREYIEKSLVLIGDRTDKASLFDFDIRAAIIYAQVDEKALAIHSLSRAIDKLNRNKRLATTDRKYLLDYCQLMKSEINTSEIPKLHLSKAERSLVSAGYRREYPLIDEGPS